MEIPLMVQMLCTKFIKKHSKKVLEIILCSERTMTFDAMNKASSDFRNNDMVLT